MGDRKCKILVLDWGRDALTNLRGLLEPGVDVTITWDEGVARKLIKNTQFDVILVGEESAVQRPRARPWPAQTRSATGFNETPSRKAA